MKVEVNIEKKYAFLIAGVLLILAVSIFVNAYNPTGTGGVPSVMGHSVDEIDWSKYLPGTGIRWGNSTLGGSLQGDASIELVGGWPYIDFKTFAAGHNPDYDVRLTSAGTTDNLYLQGGSFCFEDGSCRNSWSGIATLSRTNCRAIDIFNAPAGRCAGIPGCSEQADGRTDLQLSAGWYVAGVNVHKGSFDTITVCQG